MNTNKVRLVGVVAACVAPLLWVNRTLAACYYNTLLFVLRWVPLYNRCVLWLINRKLQAYYNLKIRDTDNVPDTVGMGLHIIRHGFTETALNTYCAYSATDQLILHLETDTLVWNRQRGTYRLGTNQDADEKFPLLGDIVF